MYIKKIILYISALTVVFLSSCSSMADNVSEPKIDEKYYASIRCDDEEYAGILSCTPTKILSFNFDYPKELKGLTVQHKSGETTISYDELQRTSNNNPILSHSAVERLFSVVTLISDKAEALTPEKTENNSAVFKISDKNEYTITTEKSTGIIQKIEGDNFTANLTSSSKQ